MPIEVSFQSDFRDEPEHLCDVPSDRYEGFLEYKTGNLILVHCDWSDEGGQIYFLDHDVIPFNPTIEEALGALSLRSKQDKILPWCKVEAPMHRKNGEPGRLIIRHSIEISPYSHYET